MPEGHSWKKARDLPDSPWNRVSGLGHLQPADWKCEACGTRRVSRSPLGPPRLALPWCEDVVTTEVMGS